MAETTERCRVHAKYGHCQKHRGHRSEADDLGHEIYFDGSCLFRWLGDAAGWISLPSGEPIGAGSRVPFRASS